MSRWVESTRRGVRPEGVGWAPDTRGSTPADLRRIGQEAFNSVPHLDGAALVEKILRYAEGSGNLRRLLETGRSAVGDLVRRWDISETVRHRPSAGVLRLLGPLGSKLEGIHRRVCDWIHEIAEAGLEKLGRLLEGVRQAMNGTRDFLVFLDRLLPGDWSRLTQGLQNLENTVARWIQGVSDLRQRLHQIHTMVCELVGLVRPAAPQDPARTQVILR
jgi:hypothetical protein